MSELLPCPFCESTDTEIVVGIDDEPSYQVACMDCGASSGWWRDKNTAIEKWNTRHYPPEVEKAVERMKPKKITYDDSSLGKPGVPEFWIAHCPECKQPIDFNDTPFEFCRRCGQKLDWSE